MNVDSFWSRAASGAAAERHLRTELPESATEVSHARKAPVNGKNRADKRN